MTPSSSSSPNSPRTPSFTAVSRVGASPCSSAATTIGASSGSRWPTPTPPCLRARPPVPTRAGAVACSSSTRSPSTGAYATASVPARRCGPSARRFRPGTRDELRQRPGRRHEHFPAVVRHHRLRIVIDQLKKITFGITGSIGIPKAAEYETCAGRPHGRAIPPVRGGSSGPRRARHPGKKGARHPFGSSSSGTWPIAVAMSLCCAPLCMPVNVWAGPVRGTRAPERTTARRGPHAPYPDRGNRRHHREPVRGGGPPAGRAGEGTGRVGRPTARRHGGGRPGREHPGQLRLRHRRSARAGPRGG